MSAVQPAAVRRSGRMKKEMYRCRYLYILIALPVIYFIIFKYVPMYGVMIAFENFKIRKGIWGSEWVGLANFTKMFSDPLFFRAVKNTIIFSLGRIAFQMPCAVLLAIALCWLMSFPANDLRVWCRM